jgi:hypothetical protein
MRSPCCQSSQPLLCFDYYAVRFVSRILMISPCCLCGFGPPSNFFVFFAVRIISKGSRPLVLTGISRCIVCESRIEHIDTLCGQNGEFLLTLKYVVLFIFSLLSLF